LQKPDSKTWLAKYARAAPRATGPDAWQCEATLYQHAAPLKGDVGVRGLTGELDCCLSDILNRPGF
jgi:hypothetical protein